MQTIYNLLSFVTQTLSIIPICCVMVLTSKLRFLMCSGGGGGGATKNGTCDCVASTVMLVVVFYIFKEVGILDKMLLKIGYVPLLGQKGTLIRNDASLRKSFNMPPGNRVRFDDDYLKSAIDDSMNDWMARKERGEEVPGTRLPVEKSEPPEVVSSKTSLKLHLSLTPKKVIDRFGTLEENLEFANDTTPPNNRTSVFYYIDR